MTTGDSATRLASRIVRADDAETAGRLLYVLPGSFGAGRNWRSFARRLVELRSDWSIVLVDLRLHGDSLHVPGPHTIEAAADDVIDLHRATSDSEGPAVLGHSFGGKVALEVTRRMDPPPAQTWVIDSTPAPTEGGSGARRMLARLQESPTGFPDREAGVAWIVEGGFDEATARWMATNLVDRDGAWVWRFDLDAMSELLEDFGRADLWDVLEAPPAGSDIHFVRASPEASLLSSSQADRIEGVSARGEPVRLHGLEGGHMLHVDNPDGLLELVASRLPR